MAALVALVLRYLKGVRYLFWVMDVNPEQAVVLGLRPQYIAMARQTLAPGHARVPVTIELVQPTGSRVQATMPLAGATIIAELAAHDVSRPGERTEIDIDMTRAVIIDPQSEQVI